MSRRGKRRSHHIQPTVDSSLKTQLAQIETFQREKEIERDLLIKKAISSDNPSDILVANTLLAKKNNPFQGNNRGAKSYLFDPYYLNDNLGYKDSLKGMSYDILRNMSRTPIIKSIITTRVEQVASFSTPQEDENKTGWTIRKKGGVFTKKNKELTDQEKYEIEGIVEFLLNAGIDKNKHHADSFDTFLRKLVPDTLSMDQMTFEVIRNRFNKPIEFFATDGATYRLASSFNNENPNPEQVQINGYYPSYVQLYQGLVNAEFYPWELCFGIRNLSTSIKNNGYGVSELEDMVKIVTWMLYSDSYNGKFFSQGAAPKGLMKISGIQNEDRLDEFRQQWKTQVSGVENAWKTPVVNADNIEWIDLQKTNQDMQFTQWQEYLIRLGCAQFKIAPEEIGFYLSGNQGGVNYESNGEYKHKYSKDKGLYPLLKFIQAKVNQLIVTPLTDGKYEFIFTGIEENLENVALDDDIKKLNAGIITWSEVRAKYNLPAQMSKDDFLLSPTWIQYQQMKMGGGQQSNDWVDQNSNGGQDAGASNPNPNNGNGIPDEDNAFIKHLDGLKSSFSKNNPFMKNADGTTNKQNPFISKGKEEKNPFVEDLLKFVDKLNEEGK